MLISASTIPASLYLVDSAWKISMIHKKGFSCIRWKGEMSLVIFFPNLWAPESSEPAKQFMSYIGFFNKRYVGVQMSEGNKSQMSPRICGRSENSCKELYAYRLSTNILLMRTLYIALRGIQMENFLKKEVVNNFSSKTETGYVCYLFCMWTIQLGVYAWVSIHWDCSF